MSAVPPAAPDRVRLRPPRSAQQDRPARVWITAYRCAGCEVARPQQWAGVMRARYQT
ncbi:hypothetical protein ACWFRK_11900 [Streptomyces sp. NPDC055157]